MLIFGGKAYGGPRPLPLAYAVYAFINVDNCERPLRSVSKLVIMKLTGPGQNNEVVCGVLVM